MKGNKMSYSHNKRKENIKKYAEYTNPNTGVLTIAIKGKKSIKDRQSTAK